MYFKWFLGSEKAISSFLVYHCFHIIPVRPHQSLGLIESEFFINKPKPS